jgi:D-alanyl-lipoteichoic acid acyltransferase DltB (MBOAT superfamily)
MLPALACALAFVPVFWLVVPPRFRRQTLVAASVAGLGLVDLRLPVLAGVVTTVVTLAARRGPGWGWALPGLVALVALFGFNKLAGAGGMLPSQGGVALLGVSYLVLKAAAALVDVARGSLRQASFFEVLAWIVFLPTWASGPIETFGHFRGQRLEGGVPWGGIFGGLERILFGLVKTLLFSYWLGEWATPVLADPSAHGAGVLVGAAYAIVLRFYFDFSGYSDIAIGVSALFGVEIQENFDNPLVRRNLAQLWQRWHMTLTAWLRRYLFLPVSRSLLGAGGRSRDGFAFFTAQLVTMGFCGLWHGLGWNFLVWGVLQAVALYWVGRPARTLGARLPEGWLRFWRDGPAGYGLSALLTFHYFAFTSILVFTGLEGAVDYARALLGF